MNPMETRKTSIVVLFGAVLILAGCGGGADTAPTVNPPPVTPSLSVADVALSEGDSGQVLLAFTVSASATSSSDISFDYATSDGSATAGVDYVAANGTATIAIGTTSTTIEVAIIGDSDVEPNETFSLVLSNAVNANIADGTAIGTISNDDISQDSGLASRPSNTSCIAPDRPITNTAITTENAFPSLPALNRPVGLMQAPGDTSQWYAIEQDGRVQRFDNAPGVAAFASPAFIDIRSPSDPIDVDSAANEAGLLGMAFHPDYGNTNWYVYLSYMIDGAGSGGPYISVVSRFESKDNGQTLDAADATELLRLVQPFSNHNGGQISFGADGYLYISFGDGGSGGDPGDLAQNTNNLFGAMLRIDVDSGVPYAIPGDNPFSANTQLCDDGSSTAACPEIYAWGLRNPWKWSFDSVTDQLWLADVGQNAWEEVDIIERGGNYGWRCREGAHDYDLSGVCPAGLIDPVIEYSHSVGNSITGGIVYRGGAITELDGRYVFADFSRGILFASIDNGAGGYDFEELLDTSFLISAFAQESDGELLFLDLGSGSIRRIVQSGGNSSNPVPDLLSATGCVDPGDPTQPASGLIPYDITAPFWSDGADKERWYAIPDGTAIDVGADGDWLFPNGTVLVKNFRLANQLIETRLFMRHPDGEWAGYTYEWNAGQTEATRVIGGKVIDKFGQDWIYPSGTQCMECHTQAASFSLGIEHGLLNRNLTYPSTGLTANQLVTADAVDLLSAPLADTPDNLPRFADPQDGSATLDARARAYLHTNCAGCHRPGGPTPSNMDLRHATSFAATNTCDVMPTSGMLGIPNARIVTPGNAATSLLVERATRRDVHGMPPLGSSLIDSAGVQLLTDWITALPGCP